MQKRLNDRILPLVDYITINYLLDRTCLTNNDPAEATLLLFAHHFKLFEAKHTELLLLLVITSRCFYWRKFNQRVQTIWQIFFLYFFSLAFFSFSFAWPVAVHQWKFDLFVVCERSLSGPWWSVVVYIIKFVQLWIFFGLLCCYSFLITIELPS